LFHTQSYHVAPEYVEYSIWTTVKVLWLCNFWSMTGNHLCSSRTAWTS